MYDATCKLSSVPCTPAVEASSSKGWQIGSLIWQALEVLATWHERARQRHYLAQLDDRLLKDIGLTRLDVARESSKAFWEK